MSVPIHREAELGCWMSYVIVQLHLANGVEGTSLIVDANLVWDGQRL
jgi:hypothetical protein